MPQMVDALDSNGLTVAVCAVLDDGSDARGGHAYLLDERQITER